MFESVSNLFPGFPQGGAVQLLSPYDLTLTASAGEELTVTWVDPPGPVPISLTAELWRSDLSEQINSQGGIPVGTGFQLFASLSLYVGQELVVIMRNEGDGVNYITSGDNTSNPCVVTSA